MKTLRVLLMVCLIAAPFLLFLTQVYGMHDNYQLDASIKITATVDGKTLVEDGNVPLLSEIEFQIEANSDLDYGYEYAYAYITPFECGGVNLYDPKKDNNTTSKISLSMQEGHTVVDGEEIAVSYGNRFLRVETKDGKYNIFVWNVVEMDFIERYVPEGFKIIRIKTAKEELSLDKNNPTSIYAQNDGFFAYANMTLPQEIYFPGYFARWCYQVDGKWDYDKMGLSFQTDGSAFIGGSYTNKWSYAGKVTGFKLQILDYDNSIITESPTYYVKWELREAQQYGLKGLVKKITLTADTLTIEPKDNYWISDGGADNEIIISDKNTGVSNNYQLELFDLDENVQLYKKACVTGLQLDPRHIYEVTIRENCISTLFDPTLVNLYRFNAEWTSELIVEGSRKFDDVNNNEWYYNYVKEAMSKNIIEGYEDGSFRPQGQVSRSEFAKMMLKYLQIPVNANNAQTFVDLSPNNWAFDYVETAKEYLTGYSDNGSYYFRGAEAAVREDLAVAMVKAMGLEDESVNESELQSIFSDWQDISPNLRKYVLIAFKNHLIDGYPGGWFGPQQTITRAETTAMLSKAYQSDAMEKVTFISSSQ